MYTPPPYLVFLVSRIVRTTYGGTYRYISSFTALVTAGVSLYEETRAIDEIPVPGSMVPAPGTWNWYQVHNIMMAENDEERKREVDSILIRTINIFINYYKLIHPSIPFHSIALN